jgi:hypothetical protein
MYFLSRLLPSQGKDVEWFQTLQQRIDEKYKFFDTVCQNMREFNKILKTFSDKLENQSKNFDNISHTLEDQYLYDTYKLIHIKIIENIKAENTYADENLKMLEIHLNKYKAERHIYSELKNIRKNLEEEKEELKTNKTGYHKSGNEMEKKVQAFVESNLNIMNNLPPNLKTQLNGLVKNPKKLLKKYKESIQKVNDLSISFNKKQNELFTLLPFFGNEDNKFFSLLTNTFLTAIQKNSEFLELTKKNLSIIQKNEKKDDLNNFINESLNNKSEEKKVELIQYQSGLEFNKCKDKNEFDKEAKVVETINKTMEDKIFPNYDYEADLKTFQEAKLIKKLFEMKEIDENSGKELLDSLDDKMNHKAMFIVLSQLRTNSTFHRPKTFIQVFGKAFNKMINMANKNEIYDYVKNCIILSQTYFYDEGEDKEKKKKYLFEEIKSNKILNNSHFWRGFIDSMLKLEFDRFKVNHAYPDYDIEKGENIPDRIKRKLDEIVFSQLLSFITNLNDFEIDKRVILKIADEFIQKYKYLSESNIESVYQIISKEKDDLEKLRKEYDASLESEIIEIKDEKSVVKKDVKEEKKEEQKEEKKEEEKKEEKKEEEKKEEEKVEKNEIKDE